MTGAPLERMELVERARVIAEYESRRPGANLAATDALTELADALVELREAVTEAHDNECGCNRPGNQSACIALEVGRAAAIAIGYRAPA